MTGTVRNPLANRLSSNQSVSNNRITHRFRNRNDSLGNVGGSKHSEYPHNSFDKRKYVMCQDNHEYDKIARFSKCWPSRSIANPRFSTDEAHEATEKSGCKSKASVSLLQAKNQTNQLANEMLKHYNLYDLIT